MNSNLINYKALNSWYWSSKQLKTSSYLVLTLKSLIKNTRSDFSQSLISNSSNSNNQESIYNKPKSLQLKTIFSALKEKKYDCLSSVDNNNMQINELGRNQFQKNVGDYFIKPNYQLKVFNPNLVVSPTDQRINQINKKSLEERFEIFPKFEIIFPNVKTSIQLDDLKDSLQLNPTKSEFLKSEELTTFLSSSSESESTFKKNLNYVRNYFTSKQKSKRSKTFLNSNRSSLDSICASMYCETEFEKKYLQGYSHFIQKEKNPLIEIPDINLLNDNSALVYSECYNNANTPMNYDNVYKNTDAVNGNFTCENPVAKQKLLPENILRQNPTYENNFDNKNNNIHGNNIYSRNNTNYENNSCNLNPLLDNYNLHQKKGPLPSVVVWNLSVDNPSFDSNYNNNVKGQKTQTKVRKSAVEDLFYIEANNGRSIIEEVLKEYGWKKTENKNAENLKLKWFQLRGNIDYTKFKEGKQLVNRIPNCNLLTNKSGLMTNLHEYIRLEAKVHGRHVDLSFLPETYRVFNLKEVENFFNIYKENELWICKPASQSQGKGIHLIRNSQELHRSLMENFNQIQSFTLRTNKDLNSNPSHMYLTQKIIQRYIANPFLINGHKFDIRSYMFIASTIPYVVCYHIGYSRLSLNKYDRESRNLVTHLTNQHIQKKDPKYLKEKENTIWSMEKLNSYINQFIGMKRNLEYNWVFNTLNKTMKNIMLTCFLAVKNKLQRRVGYFELFGFDFLIDNNMKIWLIEINGNPSLSVNCTSLKEVIPEVIKETIDISIECFEKLHKRQRLFPIKSLKSSELIYSEKSKKINRQISLPTIRNNFKNALYENQFR